MHFHKISDLSNFHYPGRMAGNRGYRAAFLNPGSPAPNAAGGHPHRQAVFRTGWE